MNFKARLERLEAEAKIAECSKAQVLIYDHTKGEPSTERLNALGVKTIFLLPHNGREDIALWEE